jgi:hypothetical protein
MCKLIPSIFKIKIISLDINSGITEKYEWGLVVPLASYFVTL